MSSLKKLFLIFYVLIISCTSSRISKSSYVDINYDSNSLQNSISMLSNQIYKTMIEEQKSKVAVLAFPTIDGDITKLGLYLADKLTNSLFKFQNRFEVVDRFHLEQVLKEMKMGMTGIQDPKTIQKVGKILGADAIVTGMITDLGTKLDINLRLLDTEQAKVIAIASTELSKNKMVKNLLALAKRPNSYLGHKTENSSSEIEISNLRAGDGKNIINGGKIKLGALFFNDRKYRITEIPKKYVGFHYIQTACNSKYSPIYTEYSFHVDHSIWLYIIWDERVPFSQWIKDGFKNTGDYIKTERQGQNYLILKSIKPYPPGEIKLYGQKPSNASFYGIMIEKAQ